MSADSGPSVPGTSARLRTAGTLLFLAGFVWWIVVTIAESLFPDYSVFTNDLSDLASTVPPNPSVVQPSAELFNTSMVILGLMILAAAYFIHLEYHRLSFTALLTTFGAGCLLIAAFPGDTGNAHAIASDLTFVVAPLAAIASYRLLNSPLRYVSVAVGIVALLPVFTRLALGDASPILTLLGKGGEERMIAYPVIAWLLGFGGSLMGSKPRK